MRRAVPLLLFPLLLAASAPALPETQPLDLTLERARQEAMQADARVRQLEAVAAKARGEAARLRAEQAAAAEAIAAAEARISAADAEVGIATAALEQMRQRLRVEQRPLASLLGGLVLMARRPPLLALADGASTDELVRVRVLLDSTLPVIQARTAALSAQLAASEQLRQAAANARAALVRGRDELNVRREAFARLEARATSLAATTGTAALGAGDEALATGEQAERIATAAARTRSAAQLVRELAAIAPAPPPPQREAARPPIAPFAYRLAADAPVLTGLGEISDSGVRSRGLTLATRRGAAVVAPAAGLVRFSGPFRDYDGLVIIDHGDGWMSLILNVSSAVKPGTRVSAGQPLGRALGTLGIELSRNGQNWSPALIAGSSATLSNWRKSS